MAVIIIDACKVSKEGLPNASCVNCGKYTVRGQEQRSITFDLDEDVLDEDTVREFLRIDKEDVMVFYDQWGGQFDPFEHVELVKHLLDERRKG